MTTRGGGDPNNSMASMPSAEWARRLGASPSKRMTASWSGSNTDPTEYRSYAGGATNSAKSTSPTTELRERPMHDGTNLPVPERTGIQGDCATLFVSLELSRLPQP